MGWEDGAARGAQSSAGAVPSRIIPNCIFGWDWHSDTDLFDCWEHPVEEKKKSMKMLHLNKSPQQFSLLQGVFASERKKDIRSLDIFQTSGTFILIKCVIPAAHRAFSSCLAVRNSP